MYISLVEFRGHPKNVSFIMQLILFRKLMVSHKEIHRAFRIHISWLQYCNSNKRKKMVINDKLSIHSLII